MSDPPITRALKTDSSAARKLKGSVIFRKMELFAEIHKNPHQAAKQQDSLGIPRTRSGTGQASDRVAARGIERAAVEHDGRQCRPVCRRLAKDVMGVEKQRRRAFNRDRSSANKPWNTIELSRNSSVMPSSPWLTSTLCRGVSTSRAASFTGTGTFPSPRTCAPRAGKNGFIGPARGQPPTSTPAPGSAAKGCTVWTHGSSPRLRARAPGSLSPW